MRYTSKTKVEELLMKAGYTREGSFRGWTKQLKEKKPLFQRGQTIILRVGAKQTKEEHTRFHALVTDGEIDLHIDHVVHKKHKAKKFTPPIEREIGRLKLLDLALQ